MTAPLDGVTILDLTRNLAGPYATMVLGDLGARVIKVERPGEGDDTRHWTPPTWGGRGALFLAINRNKESVEVDVDTPDGSRLVLALAARADVVVESNRPGSLDKRGLGYDDVRAVNPKVVYCSISAFGGTGPQRERSGYDAVVQAASGVMSINGEPGAAMPVRVGPSIIDQGAGMWLALGVLAALRRRDLDGEAQRVETSLLETGVAWMGYQASNHLAGGPIPGPQGSRHASMAPYESFHTRSGALYLAAANNGLFRRLCAVLDLPELPEDPRYLTNADRVAHRDELRDTLQVVLLERDADEWERLLVAHGLPCSQVRTVGEVLVDPQVDALGMVRPWAHPEIDDLRLIDHPISYNGTRSFRQDPPPDLGEHTQRVLAELDYTDGQITMMTGDNV